MAAKKDGRSNSCESMYHYILCLKYRSKRSISMQMPMIIHLALYCFFFSSSFLPLFFGTLANQ